MSATLKFKTDYHRSEHNFKVIPYTLQSLLVLKIILKMLHVIFITEVGNKISQLVEK